MNNNGGMMITTELIEGWLSELGATAEEVAAELTRRGVKGRRNSALACPISVYVQGRIAEAGETVSIGMTHGSAWSGSGGLVDTRFLVPHGAAEFIFAFDVHGVRPHLFPELDSYVPPEGESE